MRPSRKLRNLNVWQQGIEQHRAARASGNRPAAPSGWAKAFLRRLLGRRAAAARDAAPSLAAQSRQAAAGPGVRGGSPQGGTPVELREGMLSRRVLGAQGQTVSPPRMARADAINLSLCRDLRIWQRGKEFVAAARDGFDTGAGPEHALQRRAFWRQRSQRRFAAVSRRSASKATQSLRLLLRALAARQGREGAGQVGASTASAATPSAGTVSVGGRSRKTANQKVPQPIAAAAGMRRNKSFRDHKFRQQGLGLLEKALRAKKLGAQGKGPLEMYRPAAGWTPAAASKSGFKANEPPDASGPSSKQG